MYGLLHTAVKEISILFPNRGCTESEIFIKWKCAFFYFIKIERYYLKKTIARAIVFFNEIRSFQAGSGAF